MTALRFGETICAAGSSRRISLAPASEPVKVRLYNMLRIAGQTLAETRLFHKQPSPFRERMDCLLQSAFFEARLNTP
jgi:hypothetical protein